MSKAGIFASFDGEAPVERRSGAVGKAPFLPFERRREGGADVTHAKIEAACLTARAEGYAEALETLRTERDTALVEASDRLTGRLAAIEDRLQGVEAQLAAEAARLALAIGSHLAATALPEDKAGAIGAAILRLVRDLRRGTALEVRLHPDDVELVEAKIAATSERRRPRLEFVADATMERGDARVEWDEGAMVMDAAERARRVAEELGALDL